MNAPSASREPNPAVPTAAAAPQPGPQMPRPAPKNTASDTVGEIDLRGAVQFVWRSKWVIGLCSVLMSVAFGYLAFFMLDVRYTSQARLAMNVQGQNVVNFESLISGVSTEQAAINTELEVLLSSGLLEQLVQEMDLTQDPEFNKDLAEKSFGLNTITDYVKTAIGAETSDEDEQKTADEVLTQVVNSVRASLSVAAKVNTYVLVVEATSKDREKSRKIANRLAEIYIQNQVDLKLSAAEYAIDWLVERTTVLEGEIDQKNQTINDLRSQLDTPDLDALAALRFQLQQRRSRITNVSAMISDGLEQVRLLEAVASQPTTLDLLAQIEDPILDRLLRQNPDLSDAFSDPRIEMRVSQLLDETQDQLVVLERQKQALQSSADELEAQIEVQSVGLQELTKLEREVAASQLLFDTFLARLKEASVQASLQLADSRFLTRATNGTPVSPRRTLLVIFGFALGGLAGLLISFLRDKSARTFLAAEQIEELTHYPVLGQIPKVPRLRRVSVLNYFKDNPTAAASEALRNLRTSIMMSSGANPPQVILMSSSMPGEGKTTHALVIAIQLAALGKKVLLLDGDIRRKTIQEYVTNTSEHKLIDVLEADVPLEEAIVTSPDLPDVDILLGETKDKNAADIFASKAFPQLISDARERYDHIIIDSPPVLIVPDARILAFYADAIIFSVAWNTTLRVQAMRALREFELVGREVTGIVLSRIDSKASARYGYTTSYTYGYGYYNSGA